ncbi:MAG: hypothetical protein Q7R93_01465 [bacterium]|nr:hypothetical protein [bacterium]
MVDVTGMVGDFTRASSSILRNIFGLDGFDLNKILSLANPEIRVWATKLARAAKKKVPGDSILRSQLAERVFGWVTAGIQTAGKAQGQTMHDLLEKLSDFLESFVNEFCDTDTTTVIVDVESESGRVLAQTELEPHQLQTLAENRARILKATDAELPALLERLVQEAEAEATVERVMLTGSAEQPTEEATPTPAITPEATTEAPKRRRKPSLKKKLTGAVAAVEDSGVLDPIAKGVSDLRKGLENLFGEKPKSRRKRGK